MTEIISLGAGVQSSTMALMASKGEIIPMPNCAIFADTGNEPESVYQWLDWLCPKLTFPVIRVSKGNLGINSLVVKRSKQGKFYTNASIPAFIIDKDGGKGMLMRQCTGDYKINIIHKMIREIIRRERKAKCKLWIGISIDEISRMKPAKKKYIEHKFPLIDLKMSRFDCLNWMKFNNYPQPPRSACVFCPYHNDKEWQRLKTIEPLEFEKAVTYEAELQKTMSKLTGFRGTPYLHRDCKPLDQINFNVIDDQLELFNNECEGMCGV